MRKILLILLFVLHIPYVSLRSQQTKKQCYDSEYAHLVGIPNGSDFYYVITMKREGNRVKAKYFAAPDNYGNNVYNRYLQWSQSKNVILVSSGTYMDSFGTPVGLTIDNGIPVNKTLTNDFDGLVIVYATGGIAVSNLKNADLTLQGGGVEPSKKFDLRNSAWDLQTFINWSATEEATVFQTHLLVYKNVLQISNFNSSTKTAERRFLAVGKDEDGKVVHLIVHYPSNCTLYDGAKKVLNFLNSFRDIDVTFMINLDTGYQDVFQFYNADCSLNDKIKGKEQLSRAVNLLSYYFE